MAYGPASRALRGPSDGPAGPLDPGPPASLSAAMGSPLWGVVSEGCATLSAASIQRIPGVAGTDRSDGCGDLVPATPGPARRGPREPPARGAAGRTGARARARPPTQLVPPRRELETFGGRGEPSPSPRRSAPVNVPRRPIATLAGQWLRRVVPCSWESPAWAVDGPLSASPDPVQRKGIRAALANPLGGASLVSATRRRLGYRALWVVLARVRIAESRGVSLPRRGDVRQQRLGTPGPDARPANPRVQPPS